MSGTIERQLSRLEAQAAVLQRSQCPECRGNHMAVIVGSKERPQREACPACGSAPELIIWIREREDGPQ